MEQETHKQHIIGMLLVALGQLLYGAIEVVVKSTFPKLKLLQIYCGRYMVPLILSFIWWQFKQPLNTKNWYGDKPHIPNIWIRGFFHYLMLFTYLFAISYLPLGDASCIFYQSPLLITFTAHFVLNEKLPNIIILVSSCVLVSIGIIIICQPTFLFNAKDAEPLNPIGIISVCVSAVSFTIACVLIRTAKSAHVLQLELVNSFQSLLILIPISCILNHLFFQNERFGDIFDAEGSEGWTFDLHSILIMCLIGILGFHALLFNVLGYLYGDATKVSWLEYIIIPILFTYQSVIFKDVPNIYEIIGAVIVTIGCLLPAGEEIYKYYVSHKIQYSQIVESEISEIEST